MKQIFIQAKTLMLITWFTVLAVASQAQRTSVRRAEAIPANALSEMKRFYSSVNNPEVSFDQFVAANSQAFIRKIEQTSSSVALKINDCNELHTICGNGDFESGTIDGTQWKGGYGTWTTGQPNPFSLTEGITASTGALSDFNAHHTIVTTGTDPIVGIPTVGPGGGTYALRLGNSAANFGTEFISKTIAVTAGQTVFPFRYALVFQDPGHPFEDQPAFSVRAYDCNGNELTGVCDLGNGSNRAVSNHNDPFFVSAGGGSIAYRDWSQAQINLSAYIGQTVTIVFTNKDCGQGAHYGYTYIDNLCTVCTSGCPYTLTLNNTTTSTCSTGTICVDYTLPSTNGVTGNLVVDLQIYQNGVQVGSTIQSPTLTSGTGHCFNINPTTLGLNGALGGFDYILTGHFTINGFSLAPIIVGNPPTGQTPGTNDDYTIQCPCTVTAACKNATVTLSNGTASITAAAVDGGSTSTCGFQSMSVSPSTFNCTNIGTNNVVLTVTGSNGDVQTCNAVVTVVGETPSCSVTSVPSNNVNTGGNPNVIYLGYGPQSTTLQVSVPASGAPYTFSWSPSAGLSSATSSAPVFTPTAAGTYTFVVTATNKYGCTTTCSITICVADIRVPGSNGKVYLSHYNANGTCNTISISVNAVPTHIGQHTGDHLGACDLHLSCTGQRPANEIVSLNPVIQGLNVNAMPNPSNGAFNILIQSSDRSPITIRIMDLSGRLVFKQTNLSPNTSVMVGEKLQTGSYVVEVSQGSNISNLKVVKIK